MKLDQLIEQAVEDPSKEAGLFALLLETTLYVHAPKKPIGAKLSLIQFKTPIGVMAIPVFTDKGKADFAGRGNVRIIALQGRQLFSATVGANIVINPNDAWCILYPEEIRTLLEGGTLARSPANISIKQGLQLEPAQNPNPELLKIIEESLAPIEQAMDAWLTEAEDGERVSTTKYVVVIAAHSSNHERIARALTLTLSNARISIGKIVEITFIEPGETHRAWLEGNSDCIIYRRLWLQANGRGYVGRA